MGGYKAIEPGLITQRSVSLCCLLRCDIALQHEHDSHCLADATFFCLLKEMHVSKAQRSKLARERGILPLRHSRSVTPLTVSSFIRSALTTFSRVTKCALSPIYRATHFDARITI